MATRSKVVRIISLASLCLIIAAPMNSLDQTKHERQRVGVLLLRQADPFFLKLATALREKSAAAQLDLEIVDAESSLTGSNQDLMSQRTAQQEVQMHHFIMEGIDALVLVPASDRLGQNGRPSDNGIQFYTQTAKRAGIPVFTLDIACKSCGDSVVVHITSDNRRGGACAAEILSAKLRLPAEIVVLTAQGYSTVEDRIAGFEDRISTKKGITVWRYSVDGRRETAAEVIRKALSEHPLVSGVFAINDETALGALQAMQGRSDISLVGFDGSEEARRAIDEHTAFSATIIQDTELLASAVVKQIRGHFDHQIQQRIRISVPVKPYPDTGGVCKHL